MPESDTGSVVDRLWNRLESRYGTEGPGCGCGDSAAIDAFRESGLTREDVEAYREGHRTMADLVAALDADIDPARLDGLDDLVDAVAESTCEAASTGNTEDR